MNSTLRVICCFVAAILLTTAWFPPAVSAQWQTDVAKSAQLAAKDGKDILILFTGTPWDETSQKLDREVFTQAGFETEISGDFVLVKLEFPKTKDPRNANDPRNKWAETFGVTTYPTVVLTDSKKKPFAITGYQEGGVENYLGMLSEHRRARQMRDDYFAKAKNAQGDAKAKLLDKAISGIDEIIVPIYYGDVIEQIVELDADDKLGLRTKWNSQRDAEMRKVIMTDLMLIARIEKPAAAIAMIDDVLKEIEFPIQQKLEILQIKLGVVKKLKNNDATDALLDQMINLDGVEGQTKERLMVKKIMLMVGSDRRTDAMELLDSSLQSGLAKGERNLFFWTAKGDLLMADKKYAQALEAFQQAIPFAQRDPDVLIELISGKADALYALGKESEALQTLDNFSDDARAPADLRAEATLQKSMLMRQMGKTRLARLSENRAIEIADTPQLKGEIQKVVQRLRQRYEQSN